MISKYYCRPIKRYVCFAFRTVDSCLKVLMISHTTGEVLCCISMPFSTGRKDCVCINNKDYPWLYNWLIEKSIASPTYRSFIKDGFAYEEFCFRKDLNYGKSL